MSARKAPRRQFLKQLALTGIVGGIGMSGIIRNVLANANDPIVTGMHKITGDVRVNGAVAREGMLLKNGDTIVTGTKSQAIYVLGQDAFFQRDNSTVTFGSGEAAHVMRVLTGKILSVFGKGQRTIRTSTATIGIRGTGCYIEDEPTLTNDRSDRTYFCLCYGTADLVPTAAPNQRETITTKYHDHPLYIHGNKKMTTSMLSAPVINHSDIELALLESLVGRKPPFPAEYRKSY